jgi:hypothetical protein
VKNGRGKPCQERTPGLESAKSFKNSKVTLFNGEVNDKGYIIKELVKEV